MADAAARKRKLQELEDRLGRVEETVEGHGGRLDLVELRPEESQQYRFFRVEHSNGLDRLWADIESGTAKRESVRVTAARVLAAEVHDALMGMSAGGRGEMAGEGCGV